MVLHIMGYVFPPDRSERWYRGKIGSVPESIQDDCVQEAWLAHLEGRSTNAAISRFANKEALRIKRDPCFTDAGLNHNGEPDQDEE